MNFRFLQEKRLRRCFGTGRCATHRCPFRNVRAGPLSPTRTSSSATHSLSSNAMPSIRSGLPPASSTPFRLSWPLLSGPRSYPIQQPFAQALPVGTSSCRTVPTAQRSQLLVQSHRQWNVMSGRLINNSASIVLSDQPSRFNGHVVLLSDRATSTAQASIIRSIAPLDRQRCLTRPFRPNQPA